MTKDDFLQNMLKKGKVTQAWINKIKEKDKAKAEYKAKKSSLTKPELQKLLDTITQ